MVVARAGAAASGGYLLYLSFPPRTLWWLALPAFALLAVALHGRRVRTGAGLGLLFGLAFGLPLLVWTGTYVGPGPWLALVVLESLFPAAVGAAVAVTSRLPGWPLWAACLWVAGEAARARVPFGGFPWGRVAFGQPDGPFLSLASLGGAPLLSFATALCGFGLGALGLRLARIGLRGPAGLAGAVAAVLVPVVAGLLTPLPAASGERSVTVAVIQGNVPRLGLDFNAQRRAVLDNHLRQTSRLAADVRAGRVPRPDLVVWPENSSDVDPYREPGARELIGGVVDDLGVPVLVGAVLRPEGSGPRNTALVWQPGRGPVAEYTKRRLQPFGETMPMRDVLRLVNPLVDRVTQDFVPGTDPAPVRLGPAVVGVATCYEVAFDGAVADPVRLGAQLLAVPSNNATFGLTEMTFQQMAMSRVRAVEHDRAVVVSATTGASAVIGPDGTVVAQTGQFVADTLVEQVPLHTALTPATRAGAGPEWVLVVLGVGAVLVGAALSRRARPGRRAR
ncbi:apolipoprotein N-acyltransferase [Pseudonocardia sp. 73-21]|nr:apolipoprotein N-acyltransferase [Pseudonocardia sp. 73-21]MBN9098005.1 apolipoprotein N-acyltransferase [Pseudonocardia sp.]